MEGGPIDLEDLDLHRKVDVDELLGDFRFMFEQKPPRESISSVGKETLLRNPPFSLLPLKIRRSLTSQGLDCLESNRRNSGLSRDIGKGLAQSSGKHKSSLDVPVIKQSALDRERCNTVKLPFKKATSNSTAQDCDLPITKALRNKLESKALSLDPYQTLYTTISINNPFQSGKSTVNHTWNKPNPFLIQSSTSKTPWNRPMKYDSTYYNSKGFLSNHRGSQSSLNTPKALPTVSSFTPFRPKPSNTAYIPTSLLP